MRDSANEDGGRTGPGRGRVTTEQDPPLTAVMGAMREEVQRLEASLEQPISQGSGPFRWLRGQLEGQQVLLAECGIGKVNAAALTQALLAAGAQRLIFTGVAGGVDPALELGDIVISADAVQHDVDVTGLGYPLGEVPGSGFSWRADARLVSAAERAAQALDVQVVVGRVASGDTFVSSPELKQRLHASLGAACAEMEGAAVAQICHRWGVPFVIIRSISDSADHGAQVDFRAFTQLAAANADRLVRGLLRLLGQGGAEVPA